MRILFVTDYLPYPPISGDRIRVYQLAKRIARVHRVSIAAPVRTNEEAQNAEELRGMCDSVLTAPLPRRHPLAHLSGLLGAAFARQPLELHFLNSAELMRQINALLKAEPFDIVQFEHSRMAHYLQAIPPESKAKTALTFHNVAWQQFDTIYKVTRPLVPRLRARLFSRQMRKWEAGCVRRFDRSMVVSENDRRLLRLDAPDSRIDVVPNGVDTYANQILPPSGGPPTLLMIGLMSYAPYADSAVYFCEQILPALREKVGETRLLIVGSDPPPEVKRLEGEGVHVTGRVPDVIPYYRQATISVVPLRAGGGTRLKILESMSLGRPVVSTSLGCEGLNVTDGEHLLVADSPERFADCVARLLRDPSLAQGLVTRARARVEEQYDWNVIAAQQLKIYEEMAQGLT